MSVIIGSARIDERGKASGGKAGDQKQTTSPDYKGEVSMEEFYKHKLGWYVLRPRDEEDALNIAANMITACNNKNIGYSQTGRLGVTNYGVTTKTPTNCDCSSLVRECVREAIGADPGNFTTFNEKEFLMKTGKFTDYVYTDGFTLYTGDILVTKTKGHTAIVVAGKARKTVSTKYYEPYKGGTTSIVMALSQVGEKDTSYAHRQRIAAKNGITYYSGTAYQNTKMLNLLKQGILLKAD